MTRLLCFLRGHPPTHYHPAPDWRDIYQTCVCGRVRV